jgi:hypothetical protein
MIEVVWWYQPKARELDTVVEWESITLDWVRTGREEVLVRSSRFWLHSEEPYIELRRWRRRGDE